MKMKNRLFAWLLVLVMLMSLPLSFASAATTKYIKSANGRKVNLRHGPNDQTYAVAIQLAPGTAVTVLSTSKGWATVRYQGHTLYVKSQYLSSTKPTATSSTSIPSGKARFLVSASGRKINLRHGPNDQTYAVAVQVPSGTPVELISKSKGWAKVRYQGYVLYVKSNFVSTKAPTPSTSTTTVKTKVRYIKSPDGRKVNLRHGPSDKGYAIAVQVTHGTQVGLISSSKGWAKIRYQGRTLYVMTKYLTATKPAPIK